MVDWDLSLDPIASTINHAWIWTGGGGYFGVPISNFLGWSFTVYIFFQLFALYQRRRGSEELGRALPTTHYLQSIIVYFWTGFGFVLGYLLRPANTAISDAVGHVWQTGDIYETMAIVSIYAMIFVSILALEILYRDQVTQRKVQL
jgi:putative membrane protein